MERLEGWGLSDDNQGDGEARGDIIEEDMNIEDWVAEKIVLGQENVQTDIGNWVNVIPRADDGPQVEDCLPEGMKVNKEEVKHSKRRQKGKLTKKEIEKMKLCHNDISTMMVKKKDTNREEFAENVDVKAEEDLEKEERLDRVRRKAKEWKIWHLCKDMLMDVIEEAMEMMDMKEPATRPVVEIITDQEDMTIAEGENDPEVDPEIDPKPKNRIMQAVHTPLLGPQCTQNIQWIPRHSDYQRAGSMRLETTGSGVQGGAGMEKLLGGHRSPKVIIDYDKTPTVINGRVVVCRTCSFGCSRPSKVTRHQNISHRNLKSYFGSDQGIFAGSRI